MSPLRPQPVERLLARALAELAARRSVFDLPQRSFWQGRAGLDLSVDLFGERAATPLGPAAGPHTQLAPNLVIAWLAGARALELKTIQSNDRLDIRRPCIDAPDVGYNVEWSQELRLEESAVEYATAWLLIHALAARGVLDEAAGPRAVHFEASVGYDLAGIASSGVARFLGTMTDAADLLAGLRLRVPAPLRAALDVPVPPRIVRTVTLSTFHGCPPEEIERIVEHLFARHAVNVVVKLNPTLLGFEEVESLVRWRLGYTDVALERAAFDSDLQWDDALELFARLERVAGRKGLGLGAKFTNTLVVRNDRHVLTGGEVYLSGPPLHPVAVQLADRFRRATEGRIPISFSGGVNAENFAGTVATGMAPVTACTDLLRPTGYRRLPRYLKALVEAMDDAGALSIAHLVRARGGPDAALAAYAAHVADEPAYRAAARTAPPAHEGALPLLDCAACNNCLLVCPNDAFFTLATAPARIETCAIVPAPGGGAGTAVEPAVFEVAQAKQWAVFADACNDCGNCTTFCPQEGAPQRLKPRFFVSRAAFDAAVAAGQEGLVLEGHGRLTARLGGRTYALLETPDGARFTDGRTLVSLDRTHRVHTVHRFTPDPGEAPAPVLSLAVYHLLRTLRDAALADVNPVSAALGALPAPSLARPPAAAR